MTDTRRGPEFGVVGGLSAVEKRTAPELRGRRITRNTESLGVRLAWQRAAQCPCVGINDQTLQPDPNHVLCKGKGVIYFGPTGYVLPEGQGELDELQAAILTDRGAAMIRGVIQRVNYTNTPFDKLGNWAQGGMMVTVRPENKISHGDRLIDLDSVICFTEVVEAVAPTAELRCRYLARAFNLVRTVDTVYVQGDDFNINNGHLVWVDPANAPAEGTRLSVHYETHPAWRVWQHPHVLRTTQTRHKLREPEAQEVALQALVKLEFLPDDT